MSIKKNKRIKISKLLSVTLCSSFLFAGIGDVVSQVSNNQGTINNAISSVTSGSNTMNQALSSVSSNFMNMPSTISIPGVNGYNIECNLPSANQNIPGVSNVLTSIWGGNEGGNNSGNSNGSSLPNLSNLVNQLLGRVGCKTTSPKVQQVCKNKILSNSLSNLTTQQVDSNGRTTTSVTLSPVNSVFSGMSQMADFGTVATRSYVGSSSNSNPCASVTPSTRYNSIPIGKEGKTVHDVYSNDFSTDNILTTGLEDSGADTILDPKLYTWKECVLAHPDNPEVCKEKNYKLPKTYEDVQKEIDKGKISLSDGTEKSDSFDNIILLSNNYAKQCATSDNEAQCEENLYNNGIKVGNQDGVKLKDQFAKKKVNIEKATTTYASMLKNIKNENTTYDFMTEEMAKTVSYEDRAKFRQKARVEMIKNSMLNHFIDRIKYSKEEIVDIEQSLVKVASMQFNKKQAKNEVEAIIASFAERSSNTSNANN